MNGLDSISMGFNAKRGIVIGIDPDIKKNGVAVLEKNRRTLEVYTLTFPETLEKVKEEYERVKGVEGYPFMVYVEAGWLNKGNWHVTESRNGKWSPTAWAAAVGKGDGECSAVSKKLLECFEYYGIPATPMKPLRKCWKGKDRKITHEELLRELSVYKVQHKMGWRSNQEIRDATLLALINL